MDPFFQLLKEKANNDDVKKWLKLSVKTQTTGPCLYFGKRRVEHEYKEWSPPISFKQAFKRFKLN